MNKVNTVNKALKLMNELISQEEFDMLMKKEPLTEETKESDKIDETAKFDYLMFLNEAKTVLSFVKLADYFADKGYSYNLTFDEPLHLEPSNRFLITPTKCKFYVPEADEHYEAEAAIENLNHLVIKYDVQDVPFKVEKKFLVMRPWDKMVGFAHPIK